eukprot:TRINITY_DN11010_c0_g1_i1.p2 TRINITY_DN11010_c0_g1~~TRINITY_DN11010_c0_g1_i1.p2  ORF type:complete len:123 (-),score=3.31 TRINITY_DN11010_c0_g1_i1:106-474(-)
MTATTRDPHAGAVAGVTWVGCRVCITSSNQAPPPARASVLPGGAHHQNTRHNRRGGEVTGPHLLCGFFGGCGGVGTRHRPGWSDRADAKELAALGDGGVTVFSLCVLSTTTPDAEVACRECL